MTQDVLGSLERDRILHEVDGLPELPGEQGLLRGNDFIGKGRVAWSYGCDGSHDGSIVLCDSSGLCRGTRHMYAVAHTRIEGVLLLGRH